jgi:hypothetical protein
MALRQQPVAIGFDFVNPAWSDGRLMAVVGRANAIGRPRILRNMPVI